MTKEWGKMTIVQLKDELTQRGLDTNGKKADLISRLDSYVEEKSGTEEDNTDKLISEIEEVTGENGNEEKPEAEAEEEAAETEAVEQEAEQEEEEEEAEGEGEGDGEKETKEEEGEGEGEKKEETKEDNKYPLNVEGRVTYLPWYNNKKIAVPIREQIRHDLTNESKRRSVVMYPVSIADLADATLQEYMDRCIHFHVVFQNDWQFKEKTTDGHIGFYFANASDAQTMAKEMEDWRDDVHVKHLEPADNRASLVMEWKGQDPKTSEAVADRMVFVAPLPTDTGEEELQTLFPDALRAVIAVDSKGNPKGYGYTEYQNEAGVREAVEKYKGKLELRGEKLFVYKCCKDKPNGLLSDHVFKACQAKIRNLDQAIKRQGRFMNPLEKRNIIKQIRASRQQLNQDMRIREEMGLPLRLSQQREKERRAEREKQRDEDGKNGDGADKKEEEDMEDGDESKDEDKEKTEKAEEKKTEEKRTPSKPSGNRGGGNRNFQSRGGGRGRGGNMGQRPMQQRGGRFQQNRGGAGGGGARGGAMAGAGMMRGGRGGRGFQGGGIRQGPIGGRGASIGVIGQQRGPGQTADAIDMLIGLSQALKNQLGAPAHGVPAQGFQQGGNFNQGGGNFSGTQGGDFDERGGNFSGNQGNWSNQGNQGGGNWGNKRRAPDDGFGGDWKRGPGGGGYNNPGSNFGGGNFGGGRRQNFY